MYKTSNCCTSNLNLSCPFCGEKPIYTTGSRHYFIGGWTNEAILRCCIDMIEDFSNPETDLNTEKEAKEILFKQWNTREAV